MDSTEKALELIRNEWLAQGCPSPASIGKRANNMPSITVRRYLDGSTKHGDPAKVRALAIALGRQDIAETVKPSSICLTPATESHICFPRYSDKEG